MWFVKCIKTGKRIFCWLLVFVLIAGQSVSLIYGEELENSEAGATETQAESEGEAEPVIAWLGDIKYQLYESYAEIAEGQNYAALKGIIKLPAEVSYAGTTYPVVGIADNAFAKCVNITWIEISDGVKSIGSNAFSGCIKLEGIRLPQTLQNIGESAFIECNSLKKVEIPDGVTGIGDKTFYNCGSLEEVKLPTTLCTIGKSAFGHTSLKKIEIPDTVTSIENGVFTGCVSLEEVKLPVNLQTIETVLFSGCRMLWKVEIPDTVTSIKNGAFNGCESLEEIKLPKNLQNIGEIAFSSSSIRKLEIPDDVTRIGAMAFSMSDLEEVKLSEKLQTIENGAFKATWLKKVEVPNSVNHVGEHAFAYAENLVTARIPDHIVINNTFLDCLSLETLQIKVKIKDGVVTPVENASGMDGFFYDSTVKLNRKLEFWTEDGSEKLTGEALKAAQKAYLAVEDGDTDDNFWYGWEVVPEGSLAYEVTVAVNKDGTAWADYDRTFKLTKDNGSSFIDNFSYVEDGTYQIYDFTDTANGMDTGVTVDVNGSNVTSNPVDYYTVTFYDGAENSYGEDTRQKPQVVLSGTKAEKPADPEKANYRFVGWMNDEKGETVFDFNRKITDTTSIYAKWIENPIKYQHTITASAGEGGSISPRGSVIVEDGKNQEFLIVPDEGYEILSVKVDGIEQGAKGTYTFTNVTENHSINVEFIKRDLGEIKPTEPTESETPTEPTGPENPTEPTEPETPTEPTSPENPTEPANPGTPTEPANPENPTEPAQPEAPTSPDNQGTPGDSDSGDDTDISDTPSNSGSTSGNTDSSKKDNEPVTSGLSHTDMYATIAMIAGISYLLLYFIEKKQGMSEEKKNKLIASLIAWAKEGAGSQKGVKRVIALVLIVLILFYYHAIGKKISLEWQSVN